jgi:hypothetical protein
MHPTSNIKGRHCSTRFHWKWHVSYSTSELCKWMWSVKISFPREQPFLQKLEDFHSTKSHFTHETESPWNLHFKHSHWRKRQSRSKFTSHYIWGTNKVCECKMDAKCAWILTWHWMDHVRGHLDYFQESPFGGRPNTKHGDHGTPNTHNRWLWYLIMCEDLRE